MRSLRDIEIANFRLLIADCLSADSNHLTTNYRLGQQPLLSTLLYSLAAKS